MHVNVKLVQGKVFFALAAANHVAAFDVGML
jgi:hypothetical protein